MCHAVRAMNSFTSMFISHALMSAEKVLSPAGVRVLSTILTRVSSSPTQFSACPPEWDTSAQVGISDPLSVTISKIAECFWRIPHMECSVFFQKFCVKTFCLSKEVCALLASLTWIAMWIWSHFLDVHSMTSLKQTILVWRKFSRWIFYHSRCALAELIIANGRRSFQSDAW